MGKDYPQKCPSPLSFSTQNKDFHFSRELNFNNDADLNSPVESKKGKVLDLGIPSLTGKKKCVNLLLRTRINPH